MLLLSVMTTVMEAYSQCSTIQLIAVALPILYVLHTIFLHMGSTSSNPIVWSWIPHLRSAFQFGQDPNSYLAQCKKKYGSVFTLNLGGRHITFITDPQAYPLVTKARDG